MKYNYATSNYSKQDNVTIITPQRDKNKGLKTLVLDLDETLIHSSFQPIHDADFILSVPFYIILDSSGKWGGKYLCYGETWC